MTYDVLDNMVSKAAPCPFCGAKARGNIIGTFSGLWCSDNSCVFTARAMTFSSPEKAVAAWNRRATGDAGTQANLDSETMVRVIKLFRSREATGREKYGTTVDRKDLGTAEWLDHFQQELMDAVLYCQRTRDGLEAFP